MEKKTLVFASTAVAFLFSNWAHSIDVIHSFRCAHQFSDLMGSFEFRYPGGDVQVRDWMNGLNASQVIRFVPDKYYTEINEGVIANSGVRKILSRFSHRINLEKGALFALVDSLSKLHQEIQELAREINERSVLVRNTYQDFSSGKFSAPSTQISEEDKKLYDNVLHHYEESIQHKVLQSKRELSLKEQRLLSVDLRLINQAREKGSIVNKAIEYQASVYLEIAEKIRKKRQEILRLFAEVAQNHFATEELMMTYFGADLSQFQKHVSDHVKGIVEFEARAKDVNSKVDLFYQAKKIEEDYNYIQQWLKVHIEGLDRPDYMNKFTSENPESYFSAKNKIPTIISGREDKHWKFNEKGISNVNEFLLKVLNSEKVFY